MSFRAIQSVWLPGQQVSVRHAARESARGIAFTSGPAYSRTSGSKFAHARSYHAIAPLTGDQRAHTLPRREGHSYHAHGADLV